MKQIMTRHSSRSAGGGWRRLLRFAASACVLSACGAGDGPSTPINPGPLPLVAGTYEATVTGDRTFTRTGQAYLFPLDGRLVILMGTAPRVAGADTMITLAVTGTSPPEVGPRPVTTYPTGETISSLAFKAPSTDITDLWRSTASSGTLTVTQASNGSVVGEFAVDLQGGHFPTDPSTAPQHVHITGRFHAVP